MTIRNVLEHSKVIVAYDARGGYLIFGGIAISLTISSPVGYDLSRPPKKESKMAIRKMATIFGLLLGLAGCLGACSSNNKGNGLDASVTSGSGGSALNTAGTSGNAQTGNGGLPADGSAATGIGGTTGGSGGHAGGGGQAGTAGGTAATGGNGGSSGAGGGKNDASTDSSADVAAPDTACTREKLLQIIEDYFKAMAAHDSSTVPAAKTLKFTENGSVIQLGKGIWKTAGELKFHRDIIDPEQCATLSESVIDESGSLVIFGLRLKLENLQITEIETMVVRGQGIDAIWFNPQTIIDVKQPEWDAVVPVAQCSAREELVALAAQYFDLFVDGDLNAYPFADDCSRYEDGLLTTGAGGCPTAIVASGSSMGTPRYPVTDVERGLTVGIMFYSGLFYDIHMFKVVDGKVTRIHAMMTSQSARTTGWD